MLAIVLFVMGVVLMIFVPIGGAVVFSLTFVVVVLNYQKTVRIHKDIQDIRRHFDLMNQQEKEEYEIEEQLKDFNDRDTKSLQEINKVIEEELEKTLDEDKSGDNK